MQRTPYNAAPYGATDFKEALVLVKLWWKKARSISRCSWSLDERWFW
jgi:hypothetical protein